MKLIRQSEILFIHKRKQEYLAQGIPVSFQMISFYRISITVPIFSEGRFCEQGVLYTTL